MDTGKAILDATERVYYDPDFDIPNMRKEILADMPRTHLYEDRKRKREAERIEFEGDPYMEASYLEPVLLPDQERHMFRQYSYRKYWARKHLVESTLSVAQRELDLAIAVRNMITCANVRLISNPCSRLKKNTNLREELASQLLYRLIMLVDRFDWRKPFRFNTYAIASLKGEVQQFFKLPKLTERQFAEDEEERISYYEEKKDTDEPETIKAVQYLMEAALDPIKTEIIERYLGFGEYEPKRSFEALKHDLSRNMSRETARKHFNESIYWMKNVINSGILPNNVSGFLEDYR